MASYRHSLGRGGMGFETTAFDHPGSLDFDDEVSDLGSSMATFIAFHPDELDFSPVNDLDQDVNGARDGTNGSVDSVQSLLAPPSGQGRIVSSRGGSVRQQFGQITPPEGSVAKPSKAPLPQQAQPVRSRSQDAGKLSNEQRARNAANTRHSRTRNAKRKSKDEVEGVSDGESNQKPSKNINLQREKNRVAAAKCRAKKKSANEQQEEMANQYSTTNNYLTKEIRELKNQKTELQNYLLAHRAGVCECHGIHEYNLSQAQRLVLNARRQAGPPLPSSPSYDSAFSSQSPGSEASSMTYSAQSAFVPPAAVGMQSRAQSFTGSIGHPFSPVANAGTGDFQQMPPEFGDFLQSSPNGRVGFS